MTTKLIYQRLVNGFKELPPSATLLNIHYIAVQKLYIASCLWFKEIPYHLLHYVFAAQNSLWHQNNN